MKFWRAFEAASGAAILAGAIALLTVAAPIVALEAVEGVSAAYGAQALGGVMTAMFGLHAGSTMVVDASVHGSKRRKLGGDPFDTPTGTDTEMSDEEEEFPPDGIRGRPPIIPEETGIVVGSAEGDTETQTVTKTLNPFVNPGSIGDYAGIQKTMYNPVTSKIIGLKMHARTRRSRIGGSYAHSLSKIVRAHQRGDHVRSLKFTHHSPVRPHGQVWDSAFRP